MNELLIWVAVFVCWYDAPGENLIRSYEIFSTQEDAERSNTPSNCEKSVYSAVLEPVVNHEPEEDEVKPK